MVATSDIVPNNLPSGRIAQRLGYREEATLRRRFRIRDQLLDVVLWVMFAEEYGGSPASSAAADLAAFDAVGRRLL